MNRIPLDDQHGDRGGLVAQQNTQGPDITAEGQDAARIEAESVADLAEAQELIAEEEENAAGARLPEDYPSLEPSERVLAPGSKEALAKAVADKEKAKQEELARIKEKRQAELARIEEERLKQEAFQKQTAEHNAQKKAARAAKGGTNERFEVHQVK